jgi:cellulose synthase/poly-beta-1,6-N-acetylglucosamine synthase-like glycosyltransferase
MTVHLLSMVWVLLWLTAMVEIRRRYAMTPNVDNEPPIDGIPPSVLAVVPARNEESNLCDCLKALSASDYPRLRIQVVNDGSTDRTGEIADGAAALDPRIQTTSLTELPQGWLGKNHALWRATTGANEDWFLFLDADVRVTPSCISRAVAAAERSRADLFAMVTRVETLGFWEIAVQTVMAHSLALLFDPQKVNSPAHPRAVAACGPFTLFRRVAYESLGGHAAVRAEVVEDLRLAEAVKTAGLRLIVARGIGLGSIRMYDSLRAIVRGWSKNAFIRRTNPKQIATPAWGVPVAAVGILVLYGSPWALFAASLVQGSAPTLIAAGGALGMALAAQLDFARIYRIDMRWPWLAPLGAIVVCFILTSAALRAVLGKPAEWKGRAVA